MGERIVVGLLSVFIGAGALGFTGWLLAQGQATGVEGLFLLAASLVLALVAAICLRLEFRGSTRARVTTGSKAASQRAAPEVRVQPEPSRQTARSSAEATRGQLGTRERERAAC
jgi:hypothetical protein